MNVITKKPFSEAAIRHPGDRQALIRVYKILRGNDFSNPDELKAIYPSLDNFKYRDKWWVLDVGGNNLRIIAFIQFTNKRIYIKHIATHAEYDKLTEYYRKNKE
jgi:mRNA interferase HigB